MTSNIIDILRRISSKFLRGKQERKNSFIKISAVVPTYNTDPKALNRLVDSILNQTMSKDEYELIFIDDGSTTDIFESLNGLAKKHSNIIVKQIPNSGWGSRPRNIGTKIAKGYYVLYLDHDDIVYPEAFERVYQYGKKYDADVVNAKEVRTKGWAWGWEQFKVNNPSAEVLGIQSLLPMTPHKFYRREFLLEHNIEFNEGARVLWEDVYFNTKVFSCNAKVAILSDYPTYYWIATGENNSSSFGRDPNEKWAQIRNLIQFFIDTIPNEKDLTYMLTHWYQTRILGILGTWLLNKSEERIRTEFKYAEKLTSDLIPKEIDNNVSPINKLRAYFLRNGKIGELIKLAKHDNKLTARSYAKNISWIKGKLNIEARTNMTLDEKKSYVFHRTNDKILRDVPSDFTDVPTELLNISEELKKSTYEASIKGRNSRETWYIPAQSEVKIEPLNENDVNLTGYLKFDIDIDHAGLASSLNDQPWDIAARFTTIGFTFHRGIVAPEGYFSGALINGRTAVAYCNKSQLLTLDVGSNVHSVIKIAHPKKSDTIIKSQNKLSNIVINLSEIYVFGNSKIKGSIELQHLNNEDEIDQAMIKSEAYLIGDERGARIEGSLKLPQGKYSLTTNFENRRYKLDFNIIIKH